MKHRNEMKDRISILYLSVYDPHVPYTGTGARGVQFVNYLAQYYDIDLIYMEGSGHPGDPELERKFSHGISGVNHKVRVPFSQWDYFIFSKALFKEAVHRLQTKRFSFIMADYGLSARYGYRLSKQFRIPFIYSSHNIEYRQYLGKAKTDLRRWPLIPYVYGVEKKGCKRSEILVAISEIDAQFYSKWVPVEKMVIIPQGFDETIYHPFYESPKNDPKIILFFGNYNISTNREAVEVTHKQIVDEVARRVSNVKFQFVGRNPPQHFHHSHFEFTGFVDSLEPYIKKADVVISPVLGGWGMPTKVVESLACGKPVIATDVGARAVPRRYSRLTVCEIPRFPEAICKTLEEDRPVDSSDFEALKADFLWENCLARLRDRIDHWIISKNEKSLE